MVNYSLINVLVKYSISIFFVSFSSLYCVFGLFFSCKVVSIVVGKNTFNSHVCVRSYARFDVFLGFIIWNVSKGVSHEGAIHHSVKYQNHSFGILKQRAQLMSSNSSISNPSL